MLISNFRAQILHFKVSSIFGGFHNRYVFYRKEDGPSIEEFIQFWKKKELFHWLGALWSHLCGYALIWRNSLNLD